MIWLIAHALHLLHLHQSDLLDLEYIESNAIEDYVFKVTPQHVSIYDLAIAMHGSRGI